MAAAAINNSNASITINLSKAGSVPDAADLRVPQLGGT